MFLLHAQQPLQEPMPLASSLAFSGTLLHTCLLSLMWGRPFCGSLGTFSCSKQLAHLGSGRLWLIIPPSAERLSGIT